MLGWSRKLISALFRRQDGRKSLHRKLGRLEHRIGYRFHDRGMLETALSHLSWTNERGGGYDQSNERLEFLGDAVLDLVVSDYLYARFEHAREGKLTRLKSAIVSRASLAEKASRIGLEDYMLYSRDNFAELDRGRQTMISNSLEAIIGAIYLDGGLEAARNFVFDHILDGGNGAVEYDDFQEAKNTLLHLSQVNFRCQPNYRIISIEGPEHARRFVCEVKVAGRTMGRGEGPSKKEAEKTAALVAVERMEQMEIPSDEKEE